MITLNYYQNWLHFNTEVEKKQPFEFFVRDISWRSFKSGSFLTNFGDFKHKKEVTIERALSQHV